MSNYGYRVGELCKLPFRAECQAGVSTTVKATGTDEPLVMSDGAS